MSSDTDSYNLLSWRARVTKAVMLWALFHRKDINRLIEFGTDVNARLIEGNTFLIIAVVSRQSESVKALIRGGADVNARRDDGKSPLNVASLLGFTDIAGILIDSGADIESRDNNGRTPLFSAVLGKHDDVVTLLIERAADVNTQQNDGCSPLMAVCLMGTLTSVKLLLKHGSKVNVCNSNGNTPLHVASNMGHTAIVAELLAASADVTLTTNKNESCLLAASEEGHIDVVKLLVQSGANIDTPSNEGAAPLFMAAREGHIEVVQFLIEHHADINACYSDGSSCLLVAAIYGHTDVVCALVSAGADINFRRNDGASPLLTASQEGHSDVVKLLVQSGADIETRTNEGATPLIMAACQGHIEVVQFLIEKHADVNACCSDGRSCLMAASFSGHAAVVHALVFAGADVNLQRNDELSSLIVASQEGHIDVVKLLVQCGADTETRNNNGATPLSVSACQGHIEVVEFLIEKHADVNACCSDGTSCLLAASVNGHIAVVHALVFAGADVNLQRNDGLSPLIMASKEGQINVVKRLVQHGADIEARNNEGATPLIVAACKGHTDVVQFLIEKHADVNACCMDGSSCLWTAAFEGQTDVVRLLVSAGADVNLQRNDGVASLIVASQVGHTDVVKLLVQSGADIETHTNEHATPLIMAARKGHIEVVQFLIEQHADVNACYSDGSTCLLSAASKGHTDVVRALVSAGADVNLQRNDGFSPLIMASQEGHIDVVTLLMQGGAQVETCNNKGAIPLFMAACQGHIEVVEFLIEKHADVNACCSDGTSCLLAASVNGHTAVVHALVFAGADVNLQRNNGVSPLIVASAKGHSDIVTLLIDNRADIEMRNNLGRTALFLAALHGQTDVLNALIAHGADIDAIDYQLISPVSFAAIKGHIDVVNTLIQHKADINGDRGCFYDLFSCLAQCHEGEAVAMLQSLMNDAWSYSAKTALMRAVYHARLDIVKKLVEFGADVYATYWYVDNLHITDIASYCGHTDIARFLYDCRIYINASNVHYNSFSASCHSFDTHIDCDCNTAMHLTTDLQCMRSLLENAADVEAENVDGLRPIHYAVRTGLVQLVELLIQHGANVDAADVYGNRPLHEAVCHGLNVVQLLVHYGAKVNVQNVDGKTPLHFAAVHEQSEVFMFLLKKEDYDIEFTDVWRNTPLHYLTSWQLMTDIHEEFVAKDTKKYQQLLIHNAVGVTVLLHMAPYVNEKQEMRNVRSLASQTGLSSEQLTRAFYTSVTLKTKLYCHKETSVTEPQHMDCYGNTPLHRAVGIYGRLKMYRISTDVKKTVEFLVKRGADINAQNSDGLTPLHVARGKEAIEACLEHADDQSFTIVDKRGRNFWHLMFFSQNHDESELTVIKRLITSASDAMCNSDDLDRTPLHYACMKRSSKFPALKRLAVELIRQVSVEHINKQDRFGRTALHYAAMTEDTELIDLLKTKQATNVTVLDHFGYSVNDYAYISHSFDISRLRLLDTSSFVARNFCSITVCIQHCFFDRPQNSESSKAELHKIVRDLRADNCKLYTLNAYLGCRFDYSDFCRQTAALKGRIYEQELLADNNESAAHPLDMFAAIQSQVEKAMQYLAKEISDKDVRFACEVVQVGSAHEGTKIGCCDEFDYNFVLTDLSKSCKVCYSPESPPGFVLVRASTPDYDEDLFNSNGILNTGIVPFKFETLVKQILSSLSFCDATGFEYVDPVDEIIVQPRNTSMKINTNITLEFTKPVNGYHVPHNISLDVVPALRIDGWWPDDARREDLCQPGECLIVFTQPQLKYPWIGWTQPHGFVSFARAESRLLRDCPRVIKASYMVVKRMSMYFCQYDFFSSHVVKSALFWCLDEDEVGCRNECSSSNYSDEVSKDELWRWVQNILQRLLCFAAQDYVPSYFMPKCRQPVWLTERYLKQFHIRLYRHGLTTYTDLFSLSEQQSRDIWMNAIKSLFILSHVMYWAVLTDDDELKLFVPSTINPLMENDVCTTLLPAN